MEVLGESHLIRDSSLIYSAEVRIFATCRPTGHFSRDHSQTETSLEIYFERVRALSLSLSLSLSLVLSLYRRRHKLWQLRPYPTRILSAKDARYTTTSSPCCCLFARVWFD